MSNESNEPIILAIGGGKGGVGKSMLSSNLAVKYAQSGIRTILIDLDMGAANTHTIFGMRQAPRGLGDFLREKKKPLNEFLVKTQIKQLQIIPGSGFIPEIANLEHHHKVKMMNQIKELDADLILLDLGAGSSHHILDFFTLSHGSIVVTTPEPTAIVNAYEFLKNLIYRILFRMFKSQPEILNIVRKSTIANNSFNISNIPQLIQYLKKKNQWIGKNVEEVLQDLNFYFILNQARKTQDTQLGIKFNSICKKFLNLDVQFSGMVFHNSEVNMSILKMQPISLAFPDSVTSKTIQSLASQIFQHLASKILNEEQSIDSEKYLSLMQHKVRSDFTENLLTQKRLQRQLNQADDSENSQQILDSSIK